jgi:hypothetical protein
MTKRLEQAIVTDSAVRGSATVGFDIANKEGLAFISMDADTTFTQTYSTATLTNVAVTYAAPAVTALVPPAGGVGNADQSGCYDTAGHRDSARTAINANRTDLAATNAKLALAAADVLQDRQLLNAIINAMVANGVAARSSAAALSGAARTAKVPYDNTVT